MSNEPQHLNTTLGGDKDYFTFTDQPREIQCNQKGGKPWTMHLPPGERCPNMVMTTMQENMAACEPCWDRYKEHDQKDDPLSIRFKEICPKNFWHGPLATKVSHPEFPRSLFETLCGALALFSDYHGLFIWGKTGKAKSRLLYALAKAAIKRDKLNVEGIKLGTLKRLVMTYLKDRDDKEHFERIVNCDLLVWDDFAQEQDSSGMLELMKNIVWSRVDNGKPTFYTSNLSPIQLISRLGEPFVGRITRTCKVIELK